MKLIKNGIDPLHIIIIPGVTERLGNKVKTRLINRLYDFIIENLPARNFNFTFYNDFDNNNYFPFEISYISILRYDSILSHYFFVSKNRRDYNDFIFELQQLIYEKDKKIKKSKLKTDENWLVVYEKGIGGGSYYSPSVETQQHEYESSFKKLFYLETSKDKLFELKLKNNIISNMTSDIKLVNN